MTFGIYHTDCQKKKKKIKKCSLLWCNCSRKNSHLSTRRRRRPPMILLYLFPTPKNHVYKVSRPSIMPR